METKYVIEIDENYYLDEKGSAKRDICLAKRFPNRNKAMAYRDDNFHPGKIVKVFIKEGNKCIIDNEEIWPGEFLIKYKEIIIQPCFCLNSGDVPVFRRYLISDGEECFEYLVSDNHMKSEHVQDAYRSYLIQSGKFEE